MVRRKESFVVISLIILASLSVYFGFIKKNSSELTENDLQLKDTSQITAFNVELNGVIVKVEKKTSGWMVNNSYHANNQLVKRLFRIYKNLNISIFARRDSVGAYVQNLKMNGTKLEFLKDENIIANYWIGKYDAAKNATLLMNDAEQPIFVTSPGLSANIAKFVIADDIFWRDKRIFDFEASEIIKIKLDDFENQNSSYEINIDENSYSLFDNNSNSIEFEQEKIARYLSYFKGVRFESLEEKLTQNQLDSILKQKPLYEINLDTKEYGSLNLKLISKATSLKSQERDLNNVYGLLNNKAPLIIISYFSIDPLLKEIAYFKPMTN